MLRSWSGEACSSRIGQPLFHSFWILTLCFRGFKLKQLRSWRVGRLELLIRNSFSRRQEKRSDRGGARPDSGLSAGTNEVRPNYNPSFCLPSSVVDCLDPRLSIFGFALLAEQEQRRTTESGQ